MRFGRKKKEDKPCDHIFVDKWAIVISNYPRVVAVCSRCSLAVHRKIYTVKEVKEIENGNAD